jgi:hypothetical protein
MSENKIGQIFHDNFHKIHFVSEYERRIIKNIIDCRTSVMGGRIEHCNNCGHEIIMYNSCRNRNCPNCQSNLSFKWFNKHFKGSLPVNYFHSVFTIPEELKDIFLYNKKVCLNILFKSVSKALIQAAGRRMKSKIGLISILHTWDQKLNFHPHIHCILAGGGLSFDRTKWISVKNKNYLLPVKILSRVFRGKLLFYLNKAKNKGLLKVDKNHFLSICNTVSKKEWVVFMKRPVNGAKHVLKYLSRYTHRIGISNRRILNYDGNSVTFSYRDRRDCNNEKTLTLPAMLFIKRYILHIVPRRFVRIRFYGFLVNRFKTKLLQLCRELILKDALDLNHVLPDISVIEFVDYSVCPVCRKGKMVTKLLINSS